MKNRLPGLLIVGLLIAGVAVIASKFMGANGPEGTPDGISIPQLTASAARGQTLFTANCAGCHGAAGGGTEQGPPLIHPYYNPGHHGDAAFLMAAQQGVRQHHWTFGDMPPQPQVTESDVKSVTRFIREVQQANGIVYAPHKM